MGGVLSSLIGRIVIPEPGQESDWHGGEVTYPMQGGLHLKVIQNKLRDTTGLSFPEGAIVAVWPSPEGKLLVALELPTGKYIKCPLTSVRATVNFADANRQWGIDAGLRSLKKEGE